MLTTATGRLRYVNAGHPAAVVVDAEGAWRPALAATAPALGLFDGADFPAAEMVLAPGDTLVVVSDGVSEALDVEEREFDLAQVAAAVSAADDDGSGLAQRHRRRSVPAPRRRSGTGRRHGAVRAEAALTLRALVVDDEAPARGRLRQLLAERGDVEVVGEAEDGVEAIERIQALGPDVVFLDIQMPGCTGLDVVASLGQPRPAIIFCTAFDQHAVDAFELHAVDYLLKPVTRARLDTALARDRAGARAAPPMRRRPTPRCRGRRFDSWPGAAPASTWCRRPKWWPSASRTARPGCTPQPTSCGCSRRWRSSLRRLDPRHFFQVSRAVVVRLDAIREAKPNSDGTGQIVLANGTAVEVSRRRWRPLLDELER